MIPADKRLLPSLSAEFAPVSILIDPVGFMLPEIQLLRAVKLFVLEWKKVPCAPSNADKIGLFIFKLILLVLRLLLPSLRLNQSNLLNITEEFWCITCLATSTWALVLETVSSSQITIP